MTRSGSAKDDTLSEEDFNRLVRACEQTDRPMVNKFLILMAGRLGLRCGEIAHMKESWIDLDRGIIKIPGHEPCACKYCIKQMKIRTKRKSIPLQDVMKEQWRPKYEASARSIPFGFDREVKDVLKAIMTKYKKCPFAVKTVNWRIRLIGKVAGLQNVYPHALRATAGSNFLFDGVTAPTLKAIMGWKSFAMADVYIKSSGAMAKKELERIYGRNERSLFDHNSRRVFYLTDLGKKLANRKRCDNEEEWLRHLLIPSHKHGEQTYLKDI